MDNFKLKSNEDYRDGWYDSCRDISNEWDRLSNLSKTNESFSMEDIAYMFNTFLIKYSERRI